MAFKKKTTIVRKTTAGVRRPKRRNARPSKAFAKKVNAVISKKAEDKQAMYTLGVTQFNSGVNSTGDILRIVPTIDQGVGENQRIGDVINGKSIDVRGHFFINVVPNISSTTSLPTSFPANCRLMIRAFICSVKKYGNYDDAVNNIGSWTPYFLKNGNTSQPLDGSIQSMYLPVNTDIITVHKEIKRYITVPVLTSTSSVVPPTNFLIAQSYDPIGSVKFFSAKLSCKKKMKYDDTNFSPQNYAPFMVVSYAHLDGSSPDVLTTVVSANYVSTLNYEDL